MSATNGTPQSAREAARAFLGLGFAPIPLPALSKKPTIPDWPNLRVTVADIDGQFATNSNIGLLLGTPSGGLLDIDLDCAEAVRAAPFFLPDTGLLSGRASAPLSHWWYVTDDPPAKASEAFDDPIRGGGRLVELRSTGGQTVVPPSTYPADESHTKPEQCVWAKHGVPARVSVKVIRIAVRGVAAAALLGRHWTQGARHDASLALAGGLLRAGWLDDAVERFVQAVCAAAEDTEVKDRVRAIQDTADRLRKNSGATGWPSLAQLLGKGGEAVVETVRAWLNIRAPRTSGPTGGARVPATPRRAPIPPYIPFPTALLPATVRTYVEATAAAMNCDSAYSALPALAALGAAIGASHVASPRKDWKEPPYIWALAIGRSGAMKSPPYRAVEDAAEDINDRLEEEYKALEIDFHTRTEEWTTKKKNGVDPGPQPTVPVKKAFIKGDVTIEALVGTLQDNPRGLLIGQDELSAWVGGFVKYAGKTGASDLHRWLQLHSAGTINYTRKTGDRREARIRGVGVSVTGTIQPKILSRVLTEEFRASGFLARLLLAFPPWKGRQWSEAEVDDETRRAFGDLLHQLYLLPLDRWSDGKTRPYLVKLNPEAMQHFIEFYNENGEALATADEDMGAAMSKLEGYALRLALIFHCCRLKEYAKDTPITAADMKAAIELTRWFLNEAGRVYITLSETPAEQAFRALFEVIARLATKHGGRLTTTQLQRSSQRRYPSAEHAKAALASLVDSGYGYWKQVAPGPKGGRPTDAFVPCTMCDETDETPEGAGSQDGDESPETGPCVTKPPVCDETPDAGIRRNSLRDNVMADTPGRVGEVSSVSSHAPCGREPATEPAAETPTGFHHTDGVSSHTAPKLVTSPQGLSDVVSAVEDDGGMVGLDIETTGLCHQTDHARLLQVATVRGTFVVDLFALPDPAADLGELFAAVARAGVVGHNLGFDLPFLMRLGFVPQRTYDTMLASQVHHAGDITVRHGLKDLVARHLNNALDKDLQKTDWSKPLTPEMVEYAARDAELPVKVREHLDRLARAAGLAETVATENAALPCMAWAARHGVGFARDGWEPMILENTAAIVRLGDTLDGLAPNPATLTTTTNWNSPEQVKTAFARVGVTLESTDDDALAAVDHPLAATLREYRSAAMLAGTFGRKWLDHVAADGRVYATWKQIRAGASGRMSCKEPNLQQLPRDRRYRRCFVAAPGRVLVKADYSQIELRIAAKLTGDKRMLAAYRDNEDLHTLTARALLGKSDVTKADRQLAKAVNFGLLYGQGVPGLIAYARSNYGVSLRADEATAHRETFFRTYPGLRQWHRSVGRDPCETRTLTGRRRLDVRRFTEKLNTPVQGTGADGLKRALALLWQRRAICPGAFPVMVVHDEIVVECAAERTEEAACWVRDAMRDGMAPILDPIPVEVEVSVGSTWAG